jgi:hypothetical protein
MADFCQQCAAEHFGTEVDDLKGLITEAEVDMGYWAEALCEGCGPTHVDHLGNCIDPNCISKHGAPNGRPTT